jgi:hypothetical protein
LSRILSLVALGIFVVASIGCGGATQPTNKDVTKDNSAAAKGGQAVQAKVDAEGEDADLRGAMKGAAAIPPKGPDGPRKATPEGTPTPN